jgi:predicted Zn finger-like uncharacterized protein
MFIACRTCSASYHIPDEILGDGACQFRCARCGRSWELSARPTLAGALVADRDSAPSRPAFGRPRQRGASNRFARRIAAPLAFAAALAGAMAAVAARETIVATLPASAGLYSAIGLPVNLTGLAIAEVSAHLGEGADKTLLSVEGALVNLRPRETSAPDLRIALRGVDGRELYVWTTRPPKDRLAAGERAHFVARLAAPPPGVVDALVKFVAPGDKLSPGPEGS